MLPAFRKWCAAVFRRLFWLQIAGVRCSSRVEKKTVVLPGEYVQGALALHLELSLLWPLLLPAFRRPAVAAQLIGGKEQPSHLSPQVVCTTAFQRTHLTLDLSGDGLTDRRSFGLRLVRQKDGRSLGELQFSALTVEGVARELRVVSLETLVLQLGQQIVCARLHDAVEQVVFHLTLELDNSAHRSFLAQMDAALHADLSADASPTQSASRWWHWPHFHGRGLQWEQRLGPAKAVFDAGPGGYQLVLRLADEVLATRPLQVVSFEEYREAARSRVRQNADLIEAQFSAVNHRKVAGALEVVAEDFHSIDLRLALKAPEPDPLLPTIEVSLSLVLRRGKRELHRQQRDLTVHHGPQWFQDSVPLKPELFDSGPGRYQVEVWLDDRPLAHAPFQHQTRVQLKQEKAEALLRSLSLSEARLFAIRESERIETDHVFATDFAVAPSFCLQGEGFDEDAPGIEWRLGLRIMNLDSGATHESFRVLQVRAGKNLHADVEVPLRSPERELLPGRYRLQLCKRDQVLWEFGFRILAVEEIASYTQQVVLQSVRVEDTQLFIQAGNTRYQCLQVPDTSDLLLPEFTIRSAGYNTHLPSLQARLQWFLGRADGSRDELASWLVCLSATPLRVRNLGLRVREGRIGSGTGPCQLIVVIGGKERATLPFVVVSEQDVLAGIQVGTIALEATSKSGRQIRNPPSLQLNEHAFLSVSVEIETSILAPNVLAEGLLLLRVADTALAHADFAVQLDRGHLTIGSGRMTLSTLFPQKHSPPQPLTVAVVVAGSEKRARTITVLSAQRISNFEGQLTTDPDELEIEEMEYQRIVRALLRKAGTSRRSAPADAGHAAQPSCSPRSLPLNGFSLIELYRDDLGFHPLLVLLQRRKGHLSFSGIGPVDRFAGVAQRHLGKPFGVAGCLGPLRPGVTIRMKRDPFNSGASAGALKQAGPVFLVHLRQARKQRSAPGQPFQDLRQGLPEMDDLRCAGLGAEETHHSVRPIHVPRFKASHVTLGAAQMPATPVVSPQFKIVFAADNQLMLRAGDCPLFLVMNRGPLTFRQHRPGQPPHVHREIVKPAQVAVSGKGPRLQHAQKMLGPGFQQLQWAERIVGPVGHRALGTGAVAAELGLHKFGHHLIPIAADIIRVGGSQVGFGDLQIQRGLPEGLVLRAHDLAGLVLVVGAEAGALAGGRIHAIISAAAQAAAHQSVSCFHLSSGERKDK
jgi:hypothetical protein